MLPKENIKYADSGYQGWQKLQSNVMIPHKRYQKKIADGRSKRAQSEAGII